MVPIATYRLQFHKDFNFAQAIELLPYLRRLGVSHIYASPLLTARSGSTHGYDVTDPTRVNPELGGEEGFARLVEALHAHGLGLIVDIVPNHMAASGENAWWMDVLENGPSSQYATFFDVVWNPVNVVEPLRGKVVLPILGDHYGTILEDGQLRLALDEHGFGVHYWENRLPVDPKTYGPILRQGLERVDVEADDWRAYRALLRLVDRLPSRDETSPQVADWRRRDVVELKELLWRLYTERPNVRAQLDESMAVFNGAPGDPRSFDLLDALLSDQPYRLAYWRVASQEINYRRFFDIADLVSMRIGSAEVFEATHRRVFRMADAGQIDGLRIDHIDGLYDPAAYARRLHERLSNSADQPFYVVVEKILTGDETLPDGWPVAGTTGYDFLTDVNGLFVDPAGLATLDAAYVRVSGVTQPFEEVAYDAKRRVMAELFSGDIGSLTRQLELLTLHDRYGRDLTIRELGQAISQVIACFPVYRTYIRGFELSDIDRERIERAIAAAKQRTPYNTRALDFLQRVLTLQLPNSALEEQRDAWLRFVMRWQQFTGPIMAKGHEDTALYIYNRLVSVNDVGGDPAESVLPLEEFHARAQRRQRLWPTTLNATSTHDTKRSEDVRARINVISELAEAWAARIDGWRRTNEHAKSVVHDQIVPYPNEEWLIYQTLAGVWPLDDADLPDLTERMQAYCQKAFREAKAHTSWVRPAEDYEAAVSAFVAAILTPDSGELPNEFLKDFTLFRACVAYYGACNALAQTLLKITAPGAPDFYQGTELWDLSLVDPDNRRPVDYAVRAHALESLGDAAPDELLKHWRDGRVKLHVTRTALATRAAQRELFANGDYLQLEVAGEHAEHVIAFARRLDDEWALVIAPRWLARLALQRHAPADGLPPCEPPLGPAVWGDTRVELPAEAPRNWRNALTGESLVVENEGVAVAGVFATLPVGLLLPDATAPDSMYSADAR